MVEGVKRRRWTGLVALLPCLACTGSGAEGPFGDYRPAFDASGVEVEVCDLDHEPLEEAGHVLVVDDRVILGVSYGGGCEDHHFKLCWDEELVEEGGRTYADLRLLHERNQDACEAFIIAPVGFSLSPIRALAGPDTDVFVRIAPLPDDASPAPVALYPATEGSAGWCDPLGDSCPDGLSCLARVGEPGFGCTSTVPMAPAGAECWFGCAAGLYCEPDVDVSGCPEGLPCCNELCDLDAGDAACPSPDQTCVAFQDPALAGLEHLGVCSRAVP